MITITIKQKRVKTMKDISLQMERITTLYLDGYGNEKSYNRCEKIFLDLLIKNGY